MGFPKQTLLLISQNFDDGVSNELDVLNQRCSKYNVLSVETSKIEHLGNFSKTCSKYLSTTIFQKMLGMYSSNLERKGAAVKKLYTQQLLPLCLLVIKGAPHDLHGTCCIGSRSCQTSSTSPRPPETQGHQRAQDYR